MTDNDTNRITNFRISVYTSDDINGYTADTDKMTVKRL